MKRNARTGIPIFNFQSLSLLLALFFSPAFAQPPYTPGQILVKFRAAAKPVPGAYEDLNRHYGVTAFEPLFPRRAALAKPAAGFGQVYRLALAPGADPVAAARAYAERPDVLYAEPNRLFRPHAAPNDPRYADQGHLAAIRWQTLWDGLGPARQDIIIAIIDSGVDYTHEDLAASIWTNPAEAAGSPGVDDDGNGYVDDIRGWDFTDTPGLPGKGDYLVPDNDPMDESGHGTRVAGIAAAATDNRIGIAGAAPDAKLMALRAGVTLQTDQTFLQEDDLAAAILYAVDNGARILNLSWGAPENAFLIEDALRYAVARGVVLISSAGNEGTDGLSFPAAQHETIAVGATDSQDRVAGFSSRGVPLDLVAPGVNLLSTFPGNAYLRASGTSFSAPLVSGLAALFLSRRPDLTPERVRALLVASTLDLGPPGWDAGYGAGRIDAALLLQALAGADDPPAARIQTPRTGEGTATAFNVTARASGRGVLFYRASWGSGPGPQAWTPLLSGPARSDIRFQWDVTSLPDTVAVLRLEADLDIGRTLEHRVLVSIRRRPPRLSGLELLPLLDGDTRAYQARFTADRPIQGHLVIRPAGAAKDDTLSSGIVYTQQKIDLPAHLPPGPLVYRALARGPAGEIAISVPGTLTVAPLRISREGFAETAVLTDGALADRPADFDADGRPEIVLMPRVEGRPYSPVKVLERQDSGAFVEIYASTESFLPWSVGDADNDGALDLIGIDRDRLRLFTRRGSNPFPALAILERAQTLGGEIVDVDDDGRNEILARSGVDKGALVFKREAGGFREIAALPNPTSGANDPGDRFAVADFDGNGRTEILAGDSDGDLWIYERDPFGGFVRTWTLPGDNATDARWVGGGADIDGDGTLEFAVARATEDGNDALNGYWDLEIYSAEGPGAYALEWTARITGFIPAENGIATGDLDGDGLPDLAVCLRPDLYIFRADGPDAYRPAWYAEVGLTARPLIADLDADGVPELLFNRDGAVRLFERSAPPADIPASQILRARPLGPSRVELAWTALPGATAYRILRGQEAGSLSPLVQGLTATAYIDTGLVRGALYRYAVAARLPGGREIRSDTQSARPNPAPALIRLVTHENGQLALTFNEPLGAEAADPDGYTVTPRIGRATSAIRDREGRRILLTFPAPFASNVTYTLAIASAADTSGVPLATPSIPFTTGRPTYPSAGIADFNGDGRVDFADFLRFARAFGSTEPEFDLDGNGAVAFSDFLLFALFYGQRV